MTPYWRLFLNALDDFMLKFLICCACVQLAIEVGFSEPEKRGTGKSNYFTFVTFDLKLGSRASPSFWASS